MWFETLSVVVLACVAVVVASSKVRLAVLAYGYRLLQVVLVGAVLAAGVLCVDSPGSLLGLEQRLAAFPLLTWVGTPAGWPEGTLWLFRGLVLGAASVVLLTVAQFLRDTAKIVATNEALRAELQSAYTEIRENIKQVESSGVGGGRLGDIGAAVDQIKYLLKRG